MKKSLKDGLRFPNGDPFLLLFLAIGLLQHK
jgi:hypothetical protein